MTQPSESILVFVAVVAVLAGLGGVAVAVIAMTLVKSIHRQYAILAQTLVHPRTARLVDPPPVGQKRRSPEENAISHLFNMQMKGKATNKAQRSPIHDSNTPTRGGRAHFLSTADDDIVKSIKETADAGQT